MSVLAFQNSLHPPPGVCWWSCIDPTSTQGASSQDQSDQLLHQQHRAMGATCILRGLVMTGDITQYVINFVTTKRITAGLLISLATSEFAPVSYIPQELLEIFHVNIHLLSIVVAVFQTYIWYSYV